MAQRLSVLNGSHVSLTPEMGVAVAALWSDGGIRQTYERHGSRLHLDDSAA